MNYLAHFYLSGENENILLGNYIGDSVKGKDYLKYPAEIAKGILLHREIDTFTDKNEIFRITTSRLQPRYKK
jgi:acyl carrier protein phosphodiesterase